MLSKWHCGHQREGSPAGAAAGKALEARISLVEAPLGPRAFARPRDGLTSDQNRPDSGREGVAMGENAAATQGPGAASREQKFDINNVFSLRRCAILISFIVHMGTDFGSRSKSSVQFRELCGWAPQRTAPCVPVMPRSVDAPNERSR